jgi:glycerophosphoryl diester phosphodiesterase
MTGPIIVAHRSLTPGASENALSSLRRAAEAGADLIELDVRLSLDRKPVVFHDAFLGVSTRGRGWVRLWPSFLLTRVPIGGNPEPDTISSLADILDAFPPETEPALHLKDRAALNSVLRLLERRWDPGRAWLWLEHMDDVRKATRRLPELRCTLLRPAGWTPANRNQYFTEAQWVGAAGVSVPWGVVDEGLLLHAHQHHLRVFSRLERMADLQAHVAAGLDGIITADPRAVREAIDASSNARILPLDTS